MACRIGIVLAVNEDERRAGLEEFFPAVRNWTVLDRLFTKSDAERLAKLRAVQHDCVARPSGAGPDNAEWIVYYFEYEG